MKLNKKQQKTTERDIKYPPYSELIDRIQASAPVVETYARMYAGTLPDNLTTKESEALRFINFLNNDANDGNVDANALLRKIIKCANEYVGMEKTIGRVAQHDSSGNVIANFVLKQKGFDLTYHLYPNNV